MYVHYFIEHIFYYQVLPQRCLTPAVINRFSDLLQSQIFLVYKLAAADHLADPLWPQMVRCPAHWPEPPLPFQTKRLKWIWPKGPEQLWCAPKFYSAATQKYGSEVRGHGSGMWFWTRRTSAQHMTRLEPINHSQVWLSTDAATAFYPNLRLFFGENLDGCTDNIKINGHVFQSASLSA